MKDLAHLTAGELEFRHALAVTASMHAQSEEQRDEARRLIIRIEQEYRRREGLAND